MFDAGGVEVDAGGVIGVDAAGDALFAEVPDPEPFPLETAELMALTTINARMTVRIGCRRNQLRFAVPGGGVTTGSRGVWAVGGATTLGVGAGAAPVGDEAGTASIGLPQFGQAAAAVETSWSQSSHLTSVMLITPRFDRRTGPLGERESSPSTPEPVPNRNSLPPQREV
jgi:hypothetical protein